MKSIAIILISVAIGISYFWMTTQPESKIDDMYQHFLVEYKKSVSSQEEYEMRLKIFEQNLRTIENHNSKERLYTIGINKFADMTLQEIKGGNLISSTFQNLPVAPVTGVYANSIDWRDKGVIGPVQNQGSCLSCWAFTASATVEASYAIASSKSFTKFSEQQLLDWSDVEGNAGWNGGTSEFSYNYLMKNKFCLAQDYAYTGVKGKCQYASCKDKGISIISNYSKITPSSISAMKEALTKGPVATVVESNNDAFARYTGGIIDETSNWGVNIDKGVTVVGYGSADGVEYFIIKNSVGETWGEAGYARIKATNEKIGGIWGMLIQALIPTS